MSYTFASTAMINDGWKPRLQDVSAFVAPGKNIRIRVMRLDEIHPIISGNKWFKLKQNIIEAKAAGKSGLVTFGGAYSNHLIATAAAAQQHGLKSTGIVRGEAEHISNPTLQHCKALGMDLIFTGRDDYRRKDEPDFLKNILPDDTGYFMIPEGGANAAGRAGAASIGQWVPAATTHLAIPVGTATTITGILSTHARFYTLGFCATKKCGEQYADIVSWSRDHTSLFELYPDAYFGGFGKWNQTLVDYITSFFAATGVPLDVVYTGKMMYALSQMISAGKLEKGTDVLCIHTGGLQGNPPGLFS